MSNLNATIKRKPNPRATSSFFSSIFLVYMVPIFYSGLKKQLTEEDIFEPLDEHKSQLLGNKLEKAWYRYKNKYKKWSLHIAILNVLGGEFIMLGILVLIKELVSVIFIPYLIIKLVSYFAQTTIEITITEAYYYTSALIIAMMCERVLAHPMYFWSMHLGMKSRVACNALIYRKILRLSKNALGQTSVGQIVNITSNDVGKLDISMPLLHYVWVAPIQAAVGMYFLYLEIGVSCFFGVGFLIFLIPLQSFIAKQTMMLRMRTALKTDERVKLMNEIVSGIQIIKMYVWEMSFIKVVDQIRRKELLAIRFTKYLRAITYAIESAGSRIAIFISLVAYVLLGNSVSAQTAFGVTAIYNVLKTTCTFLFTMGLNGVAEVNVSLNRIKNFMDFEETIPRNTLLDDIGTSTDDESLKYSLILDNVSAKWSSEQTDNTLTDLSFEIHGPQLFAVIGPVGSGKSSLLNAILSELNTTGNLHVSGTISYCSQEPWLFSGNIRDNILFGNQYDEKRFRKVCKVCALESDFEQMPHQEKSLVGDKGRSLSGGQRARINLARSLYRKADIYLLDDPLSAVDANVGQMLFYDCIKYYLRDKIVILVTHQLQYLMHADQILILNDGRMSGLGSYTQLQNSGLNFAKLLNESKEKENEENSVIGKPSLSRQSSILNEQNEEHGDSTESIHANDPMMEKEGISSGKVTISTYRRYLKAGGSWLWLINVLAVYVIFETFSRAGDYFLAYWVNYEDTVASVKHSMNESNVTLDNSTYNNDQNTMRTALVYQFSGIMLLTALFAVFCNILGFNFLLRISNKLHKDIFSELIKAKMHFFTRNPIGRILNKFSSDMGIIDDLLPTIIVEVVRTAMLLFGTLILTSIVNVMLLPAALVLLIIFYLMRVVYISTSRNVKRIEATARSPIYSQMSTSLNGLSTIRAFSAEKMAIQEFDNYQDTHSSTWFLFISSTRAFGFWLDLICAAFTSVIIILILLLTQDVRGASLGLIMTQYMGLMGALQWGMRQWSELENQMTSVERVLEYTRIDKEPIRNVHLPKTWPTCGKLEFKNVSMRYHEDDAPVLHNLQFTIHNGERIGIVGRTGAGKSSIINTLFQLNYMSGAIFLDDIDINQLPLDLVRSKISIIPQESILFSGTIRKNLDPFDEYNDDVLWHALDLVKLKEVFAEMPNGLHTNIIEGGANYSVGQKQLICLARAVIRNNPVLVLDEATANVDPHTDSLIQTTIRSHFVHCTILAIAHRLRTIIDSDRILVMDAGQVVDFDTPRNLLKKNSGIFKELVETSGLDYLKLINDNTS